MKLDETSKEVVEEIQTELKAKGIELSIQEICSVASSQFTAATLAFKKGLEVRLPIFGSFIRKHGLEKGYAARELNEYKNSFTQEEFERKTLEAKLKNKKKAKERAVKRNNSMGTITFKKLQDTEDIVNIKNKFDKIL